MKLSKEDPVVAEIRKIREEASREMLRNPEKFRKELETIRNDAKKHGAYKAFLMRRKQSGSKKK